MAESRDGYERIMALGQEEQGLLALQDTERLGAAFARAFEGDARRALRVGLSGDLGAGKTTFVRGLLRELGVRGPVRSPTYSLVERYPLGEIEVVHADLYRLESAEALAPLGLDEFDRRGALWLIEWPEQAGAALPEPDVALRIVVEGRTHRIVATAASAAGDAWLARVRASAPLAAMPGTP